jgi:FkbM family methyltransferase
MPSMRQSITSAVTRRYPLLSGCATIANSDFVRRMAGRSAEELTWTRLDFGAEILVSLNDYAGKAAYFVGDLDRKVSETIKRIVRPGDRVLDIGANIGIVSLQLAKLVGKRGVVHSFEPNPSVSDLLRRSIERNELKNVFLHTCALGSEEGTLDLRFPGCNPGEGTLKMTRPTDGWSSVQVQVKTLCALAEKFDFGGVRLVKMDVEGYEPEVLRGARGWLATDPPDAIIFESNGMHDPAEADPSLALLAEQDYAFYSLPKRLLSLKLKPYDPVNAKTNPSHDMLAVRKNCEREIISRFNVQA